MEKIWWYIMTQRRQRELNEATRLLRRFRTLPKNQQQRQVNRLLAEQRHLDNTVYERRVRRNEKLGEFPVSGNREYLKTGRGILFPVGVKSNGSLIWKTEDVDFLAEWLSTKRTNPWTRQTVGEPTLPKHIYYAVLKKAGRIPRQNPIPYARRLRILGEILMLLKESRDDPDDGDVYHFTRGLGINSLENVVPPDVLNRMIRLFERGESGVSSDNWRRDFEITYNKIEDYIASASRQSNATITGLGNVVADYIVDTARRRRL